MFSLDFLQMLLRFVICFAVNFVIIDRLYYPKSHRREFYFTYLITSVAIFFLMFFMMTMKAKATMGIGIGLFGIFSIMRFRTDAMPVREMCYLFLIISLSVISAVAPIGDEFGINPLGVCELVITDIIVLIITWLCERTIKTIPNKVVQYDRIELCKPEHYDELLADLTARTGLDIIKIEVGGLDYLKDTALLRIYYTRSSECGMRNAECGMKDSTVNDRFKAKKQDMQ